MDNNFKSKPALTEFCMRKKCITHFEMQFQAAQLKKLPIHKMLYASFKLDKQLQNISTQMPRL